MYRERAHPGESLMKTLFTEAQADCREPGKDVETPTDQSQQEATTFPRFLVIQDSEIWRQKEGPLLDTVAIKGTRNSREGHGLKAPLTPLSPSLLSPATSPLTQTKQRPEGKGAQEAAVSVKGQLPHKGRTEKGREWRSRRVGKTAKSVQLVTKMN